MSHSRFSYLLFGLLALASGYAYAVEIPFDEDGWQVLSYRNIPVNQVRFADDGMEISVNGSAGAIIHPLPEPAIFNKLTVLAKIDGEIDLGGKPQGSKGADDFRLRVGLVYSGTRTLNFFQRMVAAKWIRTLYDLAPKGATGISRVEFFNSWQDSSLANQVRDHPHTDLWREHFVLHADPEGRIDQSIMIPSDKDILAVWISVDGDDTGSTYRVWISSLTLGRV